MYSKLAAYTTEQGAHSLIYGCVSPNLRGGEYVGPKGRGADPTVEPTSEFGRDARMATKLWEESVQMITAKNFPLTAKI